MRNPQIALIALASTLANSDYAFLEPTLGDHAKGFGHAHTEAGIGMLFSVSSVTYTLACPLIGMLANRSVPLTAAGSHPPLLRASQPQPHSLASVLRTHSWPFLLTRASLTQTIPYLPSLIPHARTRRERFGPRPIIVTGLLLQLIGFLLIGPSPLLNLGPHLGMTQLVGALVLFGAGESMSMTPVMDDMMHSCGDLADASVNSLSSILAASFSLGQMVRAPARRLGGRVWERIHVHAEAGSLARLTGNVIIRELRGAASSYSYQTPPRLAPCWARRSPRASPSLRRARSWRWYYCCTPRRSW